MRTSTTDLLGSRLIIGRAWSDNDHGGQTIMVLRRAAKRSAMTGKREGPEEILGAFATNETHTS